MSTRESVTLGSTENVFDGTLLVGGKIYGLTNGSPAKLLVWDNPDDLATYSVVTFTESGHLFADTQSLIYNSTTGLIYAGFGYDYNDDPGTFPVVAINPTDLSWSVLIRDAFGTDGLNTGPVLLESDDTYLYVATFAVGEPSTLRRYLLDGTFVNELQLPTGARQCHVLRKYGSRLYVSGTKTSGGVNWWFGWVELDLSAASIMTVGANLTGNDDSIEVGDEVWIPCETDGNVYRLKKDLSGFSTIYTGAYGMIDSIVSDGTYVWVSRWDTPGSLIKIDPTTYSVVSTTALLTGETQPNELLPWNDCLVVFCTAGGGHNARAIRVPGLVAMPFLMLEDGSGAYELEDASGGILLEA